MDPASSHRADFHILMVCTANQCRSPLAEHLFRREVASRGYRLSVESAGTLAKPGCAIHPRVAQLLAKSEIDTSAWRSQIVDEALLERADLILTATDAHRTFIAQLRPSAMPRTFPLMQYAYLASNAQRPSPTTEGNYWSALHQGVLEARGHTQPIPPDVHDIADPIGRSFRRFRSCAEEINQAIHLILGPAFSDRDATQA